MRHLKSKRRMRTQGTKMMSMVRRKEEEEEEAV